MTNTNSTTWYPTIRPRPEGMQEGGENNELARDEFLAALLRGPSVPLRRLRGPVFGRQVRGLRGRRRIGSRVQHGLSLGVLRRAQASSVGDDHDGEEDGEDAHSCGRSLQRRDARGGGEVIACARMC